MNESLIFYFYDVTDRWMIPIFIREIENDIQFSFHKRKRIYVTM